MISGNFIKITIFSTTQGTNIPDRGNDFDKYQVHKEDFFLFHFFVCSIKVRLFMIEKFISKLHELILK